MWTPGDDRHFSTLGFLHSSENLEIRELTKTNDMATRGLKNTVLFICDIQERFRGIIHEFPAVIKYQSSLFTLTINRIADKLLKASKILNIPVYATTQNVFFFSLDNTSLVH
jgi:hypothetical protein